MILGCGTIKAPFAPKSPGEAIGPILTRNSLKSEDFLIIEVKNRESSFLSYPARASIAAKMRAFRSEPDECPGKILKAGSAVFALRRGLLYTVLDRRLLNHLSLVEIDFLLVPVVGEFLLKIGNDRIGTSRKVEVRVVT